MTCLLHDAPDCADQRMPPQLTHPLDRAFALLADVRAFNVQPTRRRYQRIGALFTQAGKRAAHFGHMKKPRLTQPCADELQNGIQAVVVDVAAECVGLGLCHGG
jgi:hypothetical protein